jgi:CubicO group peptidase (beta-lactamase class C family)
MRLCSSRLLHHLLAGIMVFLCLLLLLSACSTSTSTKEVQIPQRSSLFSLLDAFLTSQVEAQQFSGTVLVARSGHLLLDKGYGLANADRSLVNTPTTLFGIGSVTKEFTAMAILILQERGKLHIHDRICIYLSPCPQAWQPITIYELLTHSSGIPDHFERSGITLKQLEAEPLDFKPSIRFNYSNSGYVVLATLIEKVSGEAYGAFLQQNIFTPLQMRHTGYDYTQPQLANMAIGYEATQFKVDETGISLEFGADGLYSTVEDLYRWDQALFAHTQTLMSSQALNEMFTDTLALCPTAQAPTCSLANIPSIFLPATISSPISMRYGYGWFIATVEGSTAPIFYHGGSTWGFKAYNGFYSADNVTIIVFSNLLLTNPGGITQSLHQIVTTHA